MTDADMFVADLIGNLNKLATSEKARLSGDLAQHTWGVPIPNLAFQWLIGGCTVLPCQRYFGVSGIRKSFKSTLQIELGNWFIANGGVHQHLDTENKTSPTMLDAMSWWREDVDPNRRIFKVCGSTDEWMDMVTATIERLKALGERKQGERIPILIGIDSLTGRQNEAAQEDLRKEGHAAERGYPVAAGQVTRYLETLSMLGTTAAVSWVQHMKESMDQTGYGKQYKEKGASAASFAHSTHVRVSKGKAIAAARHSSAPYPEYPVEGYLIYLKTTTTCIGPDNHTIEVPLLWQYVPQEDGSSRQAMWFDWHGALGALLVNLKYGGDKAPAKMYTHDKERLEAALSFTRGKKSTTVNCKALGIAEGSFHELGKAIHDDIEVYDRISRFLNITELPDVQAADIEFAPTGSKK